MALEVVSSQLVWAFQLLVLFQLKHFIADFPLQREYMLKKFLPGWEFFIPLATHCFVHALLTLAIVIAVNSSLWWLAVIDFFVHFIMDRIKSGPKYLGRFQDRSRAGFWNSFGLDQMIHHLTGFYIIWIMVQ
jgi:hypothetical protein